jgi:hypothetical protein
MRQICGINALTSDFTQFRSWLFFGPFTAALIWPRALQRSPLPLLEHGIDDLGGLIMKQALVGEAASTAPF